MISALGLACVYAWLPWVWSQWKCVLMILRTGIFVTDWISRCSAAAAEGLECESTTITPSLVRITAALQFVLKRGAAIAA